MRVLLGPILFALDVVPENQVAGIGLCLALIPCLLSVIIRPRLWSLALSVLAGMAWLFLGVVGLGIGC